MSQIVTGVSSPWAGIKRSGNIRGVEGSEAITSAPTPFCNRAAMAVPRDFGRYLT